MNGIPLDVNTVLLILSAILLIFFITISLVYVRSRKKETHTTKVVQSDPPPEEPPLPRALLVDESGVLKDPRYQIKGVSTLIGRTKPDLAENLEYLTIDSSAIGRRHAIIEYKHHCFWLSDLKSLNGTFLNGKKITSEVRLKHGDSIGFHKFTFGFILPSLSADEATVFAGNSFLDTKKPSVKEAVAEEDKTVVLNTVKPLGTEGRPNPISAQVEKTTQTAEKAMEEDQTVVLNPNHPSRSENLVENPGPGFADDQTVILTPKKRQIQDKSKSGGFDFDGDTEDQPTIIMQPKNMKRPPDNSV